MIDGAILSIIPPLIAAVLTYIVSTKKSRVQNAKILSDVQIQAIEQVRIAEESMRAEVWSELNKVRKENADLRDELRAQAKELSDLRMQLDSASHLRITLTEQVHTLESLVGTYKNRIVELERQSTNK